MHDSKIWIYALLLPWMLVHVSESVPADGCEAGTYQSNDECTPCGQCRDGVSCDKRTGLCPDGCQKWFAPSDFCTEFISADNPYVTLKEVSSGLSIDYAEEDHIHVSFNQSVETSNVQLYTYFIYKIQYAEVGDEFISFERYIIPVQADPLIMTEVVNLKHNTKYKFRVVLYRVWDKNEYDLIGVSAVSFARTECKDPDEPRITNTMLSPEYTSVHLEWEPIGESGCNGFLEASIMYEPKNGSRERLLFDPMSVTEITLHDLIPDQMYAIWIVLKNDNHKEIHSHDVNIYTAQDYFEANPVENTDNKNSDDDSKDVIAYVALAIACIAILVAIAAMIVVCCRRSPSTSEGNSYTNSSMQASTNGKQRPSLPTPINDGHYEELNRRPDSQGYEKVRNETAQKSKYCELEDTSVQAQNP